MIMQRIAAAAAVSALLVSSSAMADVITKDDLHPAYDPQYVQLAAANGHFPVVLVDSPLGGNALLKELSLPGYFPQAPLAEATAAQAKGGHLVLAFHAPVASTGATACKDPAALAGGATGGELRVQAAFCSGNEVLSEAVMTAPAPARADDPAFKSSMQRLLASVLSRKNPNDDGACGMMHNC